MNNEEVSGSKRNNAFRRKADHCAESRAVGARGATPDNMRALVLLVTAFLLTVLVSSSPNIPRKEAISENRYLYRRSPPGTKGGNTGVKGLPTLAANVRKGEYVCGNRICKLKPGEVPKGCDGICQYRV